MRFRRRQQSRLILLLLPSLVSALPGQSANAPSLINSKVARGPASVPSQALDPAQTVASPKFGTKGTKYAPVDGNDGIPHHGPWVDMDDRKKSDTGDGELITPDKSQLAVVPLDPTVLEGIPQSNDGVMDDPKRDSPKVGTTGTEGGITEKDKARKAKEGQTGERIEKIPDSPKKPLRPLDPPSGTELSQKAFPKDFDPKDEKDDVGGLEKPNDLPENPHGAPNPLPNSANKGHLDITKPATLPTTSSPDDAEADGIIQPLHSYLLALSMILFSEIGDKTFLIAALMAMKHDRMLVFSAALAALVTMTVLSAVLGHAAPLLFPQRLTNFLAAGLFLVFGVRLLREGLAMSADESVSEEMKEVEMELEEKEKQQQQQLRRSSTSPYSLEMGMGPGHRGGATRKSRSGSRLPSPPRSPSLSPDRSAQRTPALGGVTVGLANLFSLLLSPAWVQTFVMTFLGEWGDRSQIATIAMAAGQDYWWVTGGAVSGHAVCTGVAVIGGRAIAGRVSMRVVTLGGAIAFLVFGLIYFLDALYHP